MNTRQLGIAVNNGTIAKFVDLGDGADVARAERIGFCSVLALQDERMSGFDAFLAVVDINHGILCHHALMNAEDTDLADVGVIDDFEDLSNKRQVLVGHGLVGRSVCIEEECFIGFCRAWQMANDHLHEVADAD